MYTILINDMNEIVTTIKHRIMQKSKLVDTLRFLVASTYNGLDMSNFTVILEYVSPETQIYRNETLVLSETRYKDKLDYRLPVDTNITKEAGDVDISLSFFSVGSADINDSTERIRRAGPGRITILPYHAWDDDIVDDAITDDALTAVDQRMIQVEKLIQAANEFNTQLDNTKADNIIVNKDNNTIQLTANGMPIGDAVEWGWIGGSSEGSTISNVEINDNGDLIVTMSDGREINAGHVGTGADGVTFIPHVSEDYVLSWTNDGGLENPDPIDLTPSNDWEVLPDENEMTEVVSVFKWEQL